MTNNYNYIIFHKNCFDGFTCFVILNKTQYIDKNALIFPDVPSAKQAPSNIDNKDVIIMDVAYKYEVLKNISERAKSVLFIDHHNSTHQDVVRIEKQYKNLKIVYDEKECGSSLVWKYFFPKKEIPLFVKYIKDNDIGTWKLKHTISFITGLDMHYTFSLTKKNIEIWNNFFEETAVTKLISKSKYYKKYIDFLLKSNSEKYSMQLFPSNKIYEEFSEYFKKPGEFKVAVVCGGCPSVSLLGNYMMHRINCDFVLFWTLRLDTKDYILQFRSKKNGVDVGQIAKLFGGGGHKPASSCAFSMNKLNITDLFMTNNLLPRQSKKSSK